MDAAVKLIRHNGLGGLRTVEVADLAGVSRGALMHHFPSKHELVVAVLTYVNEVTFTQSTRRAQSARHDGGDPIDSIIKDAQDFFFGDYFFIELAIGMSDESTRRLKRETQQFARQTRFSIEATWLDTLISSGIPEQLARDVLALTLSVVRGFSVRMLIENDPERFSRLLAVWRKIVRQHIEDSLPKPSRKRT
ncbi:TetR/AcrR family transcriptional regulator [Bradyrhizobium sp. Ce-3]|uniref:TetR/AcrR family transcriptional regulator n=1 Tax=Bradyrhizobium sp. Ce-3 TaxID=2913970 RepID=UPI0024C0863E|nr:TetR/AcrR family transcriptional regulator [Bradyrhizobium sp. Ce-3]